RMAPLRGFPRAEPGIRGSGEAGLPRLHPVPEGEGRQRVYPAAVLRLEASPLSRDAASARCLSPTRSVLEVVVEGEFVGVGAESDGFDLGGALEADPGVDEVGGEDAAFEEVVVVGFEVVDDL